MSAAEAPNTQQNRHARSSGEPEQTNEGRTSPRSIVPVSFGSSEEHSHVLYFERERKLKCQPQLASEESSRYERLQETSHNEDSGGKVGLVLDLSSG